MLDICFLYRGCGGVRKEELKKYRALLELLHLLWYVGFKNKGKKDQDLGRQYCITIQNIVNTYRLNPSIIMTVYTTETQEQN